MMGELESRFTSDGKTQNPPGSSQYWPAGGMGQGKEDRGRERVIVEPMERRKT